MSDQPGPSGFDPTPERGGLSGAAKWAIALVAVVAAVVAFALLSSAADDDATSEGRPAATASTPATSGAATSPTTSSPSATATTPAATTTTPAATTPAPSIPTIDVVGGQPEGGVLQLSFDRGDRIRFRVASDAADDVHVHGYDIEQPVAAGGEVEFDFEATLEGRFEVELHHAETQIARIDVAP